MFFEAHATDSAQINQVGGDQHLYFEDGTRVLRSTIPGQVVDVCPYPGLAAFGPEHAAWFHGRGAVLSMLMELLDRRDRGIQMIIAPSGAGKSSLLGAGLLPKLRDSTLPGSRSWPQLLMTPGTHPVNALKERIAALVTGPIAEADCVDVLKHHLVDLPAVLVVDQFEEFFTLCADDSERHRFLMLLEEFGERIGWVVIGLRADFYGACLRWPLLFRAVQDQPLLLKGMTVDELRQTILNPARQVGMVVDYGLVELLLRDLGADQDGNYEIGRLPLLAHALRASWQQRNGRTLTVSGYLTTGGISGAIATTADNTLAGMTERARAMAPGLLARLVKFGEADTPDARRALPRSELVDSSHDHDAADEIVNTFTRARLLTADRDTITITHDELLRSWPRLRTWLSAHRDDQLIEQALREAAVSWRERGDQDSLYRGTRLDQAREWARRAVNPIQRPIADFLDASNRLHRRTARRRQATIAVLTALGLIASAAAVFAFQLRAEALNERDLAVYNRVTTEADRLRSSDLSLSAQLALVAHRLRPSRETTQRLLATQQSGLSIPLTGHTDAVSAVAYTPDGRTVASASWDKSFRLWDLSDPEHPVPHGPPIIRGQDALNSVVFSSDGQLMATADWQRVYRLWDVRDPSNPLLLSQTDNEGQPEDDADVALSPDGKFMWGTGIGDTLAVWDISDPRRPIKQDVTLDTDLTTAVDGIHISPDGRLMILSGDFGGIEVWDISEYRRAKRTFSSTTVNNAEFTPDGRYLAFRGTTGTVQFSDLRGDDDSDVVGFTFTGHTNAFNMAFSPDGAYMATASDDQTIRIWDMADINQPTQVGPPLTGHANDVSMVRFSPDGQHLVSAGADRVVRLWSLPRSQLLGHSSSVTAAVFDKTGTKLATTSTDRSVRFWDIADPAEPRFAGVPVHASEGLFSVESAWSPDGRLLSTLFDLESVQLWDVSDVSDPVPVGERLLIGDAVFAPQFSPKGGIWSAAVEGEVRFWDVTDPENARLIGRTDDHEYPALTALYSPSGDVMAIGHGNGDVVLWDVSDPSSPRRLADGTRGYRQSSLAFSPDGRILASVSTNEDIQLWSAVGPEWLKPLARLESTHVDAVNMVAFSPDGRTLASGSDDHTIQIWDVSDPTHPFTIGQPLVGHSASVRSVTFSRDGQLLASAGEDNTVLLWSMDVGAVIDRICALSAGSMTEGVWRRFVDPNIPFRRPCSADRPPAPRPPGDDVNLAGVWKGSYHCLQGETSLQLTVSPTREDGFISARLDLGPTKTQPDIPEGSYTVHGQVTNGRLRLWPGRWIKQPDSFVMIGLGADIAAGQRRPVELKGKVLHRYCGDFTVTRAS
ncbi:hypothetical protein HerbRD11066_74350 [Herbidospora sp. RD11066]